MLVSYGWRAEKRASPILDRQTDQLWNHVTLARAALHEGNFQSAAAELAAANKLRASNADALSPTQTRELLQWLRQANLLADLLTESLEEVLRHVDGLPAAEGESLFANRYRGKAFILYCRIRRDANGGFHADYELGDGMRRSRLALAGLELLHDLPLQNGPQVLIGARLAALHRAPDGEWNITLAPKSGVLLTDPGAAAACCFQLLDDSQLQEVVQRQAGWLASGMTSESS
jgi:hypothetical protein